MNKEIKKGDIVGTLKVIKKADGVPEINKNGESYKRTAWHVQCSVCGKKFIKKDKNLKRSSNSRACFKGKCYPRFYTTKRIYL